MLFRHTQTSNWGVLSDCFRVQQSVNEALNRERQFLSQQIERSINSLRCCLGTLVRAMEDLQEHEAFMKSMVGSSSVRICEEITCLYRKELQVKEMIGDQVTSSKHQAVHRDSISCCDFLAEAAAASQSQSSGLSLDNAEDTMLMLLSAWRLEPNLSTQLLQKLVKEWETLLIVNDDAFVPQL